MKAVRGPGGAGVLFIMQRRDCTSPRAPLSSTPLHPPGDATLRRPASRAPPGRPLPPSGTTSHGSPVQRRTDAKYNREAPRLMSRPNKAKNRPLNNARCNVGAAAETLHGIARNARKRETLFFEISRELRVVVPPSIRDPPPLPLGSLLCSCGSRRFLTRSRRSTMRCDVAMRTHAKISNKKEIKNEKRERDRDRARIRSTRDVDRHVVSICDGRDSISLLIFGIFNGLSRPIYPGE